MTTIVVDSPLVIAARHGRKDEVESLLRTDASCIDVVDAEKQTACHAAVQQGHVDVLAVLLKHKPNLNLKDSSKRRPLDAAVLYDRERCAVMLIEAGAPLDKPDTVCAAAAMSTATLDALISRGVSVRDLADWNQRTPLHLAAIRSKNRVAVMEMLVNVCGVELDKLDATRCTATYDAALHGKDEHLRWLVQAGANVELVNREGYTALHEASFHAKTDCVLSLVAAGANVHAVSIFGQTACHLTLRPMIIRRDVEQGLSFALLLAAGADIDVADNNGTTARQLASSDVDSEQVDRARRLIAHTRLDFVRRRALQVCIGLQSRGLDALQMCEILQHACGPLATLIPFHQWWKIATTVKHFHRQ